MTTSKNESQDNDGYTDTRDLSNPSITIRAILSHVFRRPYLSVSPETPFNQLGTYLATGHQIYVDGLIVARDKKLVGRIGGKQILDCLLKMTYNDWPKVKASELMDESTSSLELDSSLNTLLKLFAETRFALAPITHKSELIGSIGIRDLLPLVSKSKVQTEVMTIGSDQIHVNRDETLRNSIEIMLKERIRNLVFSARANGYSDNGDYIVNDRKILEFIFSYEGKKLMITGGDLAPLSNIQVDSVDMIPASHISQTETVSKAANMLRDINTPALLSKNQIITPWDVIMKTIWKED